MVTDLIKTPRVKNLIYRDHLQAYPDSIVNVTLHNIIIIHKDDGGNETERWVNENKLEE